MKPADRDARENGERRPPRLRDHPGYPFRPEIQASLAPEAAGFVNAPDPGAEQGVLLREFVHLSRCFAFLERIIQGDILYDLPVHLQTALAPDLSMAEQGERLAAEELGLIDWQPGPSGELAGVLDDLGIKVFFREGVVNDRDDLLWGAFRYTGEVGPAIVVGTTADDPRASFVLSHEFGHLVADVSPYRPRCCSWEPRNLTNARPAPEEERADRFARALLMPAAVIRALLAQLAAPGPTETAGDPREEQIARVFEAPASLVARRLEDLGLPPLPIPAFPDERRSAPADGDPRDDSPGLVLPVRYVNLALAAYGNGIADEDELARFLDSDLEGARRMIEWAQLAPRTPRAEHKPGAPPSTG